MAFKRHNPFEDNEYECIKAAMMASIKLKQNTYKISREKYQHAVKEYQDFLDRLKRLQEWGDPIECGRAGSGNTDNVFGWALDQLTWTQDNLGPGLECQPDWIVACQALKQAALNLQPTPVQKFDQMFAKETINEE